MRAEKLWIVTRPHPASELGDICFQTDVKGLALQLTGGFDPEDIHAVYTAMNEAQREAECVLAAFKRYDGALREESR